VSVLDGTDGALEVADRPVRATVHGEVKDHVVDAGGQPVALTLEPVTVFVDGCGRRGRQQAHIVLVDVAVAVEVEAVRLGRAERDAEVRRAARVARMIDVAALVLEDGFQAAVEAFVGGRCHGFFQLAMMRAMSEAEAPPM
jgi:hypothetical protein